MNHRCRCFYLGRDFSLFLVSGFVVSGEPVGQEGGGGHSFVAAVGDAHWIFRFELLPLPSRLFRRGLVARSISVHHWREGEFEGRMIWLGLYLKGDVV